MPIGGAGLTERKETSSTVFSGRIIEVRLDEVRLEDGSPARREVVVHSGSVAVVVFVQREVLLVRQFRYPVQAELWEIPAGRIESGERPAAAAARELAEEAGLRAGDLEPLLDVFLTPGYSSERMQIYLARGAAPVPARPDADERIEARWFPFAEAVAMCLDGRIRDVKTVAGLLAVAASGACDSSR